MKNGMEDEILKGLLSSAYTYKDIGMNVTSREAGDNEIETTLKNDTGYDFTWFDGDTRKNSSLGASVIGTQAADTVIEAVIKNKQTFTSNNTQVAGKAYFVAYVPVKDETGEVVSMAFTGVSRESVNKQISRSVLIMILIGTAFNLVIITFVYRLASNMADAVKTLNSSIDNLANGRFIPAEKHLYRQDEIGKALNSTNSLVAVLNDVISHIKDTSKTLQQSSTNLDDTSKQIAETADTVQQL
jgi:methyl-accepting chemotaxis protein